MNTPLNAKNMAERKNAFLLSLAEENLQKAKKYKAMNQTGMQAYHEGKYDAYTLAVSCVQDILCFFQE